jgi:pimeloyl-ACP methyl ester carboxylesterase
VIAELAHVDDAPRRASAAAPLVLLHAFPLSRAMFVDLADALAVPRRVVTPDLRGFGDSPLPADDAPSIDLMADDVVALLDRLAIDRAVVGGVSMGGYVVMAMVRRHPDRVAGVAMIDTKAGADTAEARTGRHAVARSVLTDGAQVLRPMIDDLLGETTRRYRPDVVARVAGWIDTARPDGVAWAQRAMAARPESFETLAAATVPGFVVVGAEDTLSTHDDALMMSSAMTPHAPVHVIPRAGHLSPVEDPEAVAGALREGLGHLS